MKHFPILPVYLLITLIISACGARVPDAPTPMSEADIQGTVAAAAFTVIAETQAAIPTATPSPTATITETPLPTNTFVPLPPPGVTFTPVPSGNSGGGDPCINQVMPATLKGEPVRMRIDNSTRAKLSVSVYLNQTVPNGQCGYRSYTIDPQQSIVLNNLIEGCYTLWAWNPVPDDYFIVTNGTNCIDKSDTWVFDISTGSITLKR